MPANSETTIRGGYQPFQLKRDYHLDIFGDALNKITQQHQAAIQQRSAITKALAEVKLNAADEEWKQNYINDIQKQIDNASQFGNYSTAVDTAIRLAGEAVSNPELLARQQRNVEYEQWREGINKRAESGAIDERTRKRVLEENPYTFVPNYDANGNIISTNHWEDNGSPAQGVVEKPVNKVSLEKILSAVDGIVAAHRSGGSGYTMRDSKGNVIGTYDNKAAFATKTHGSSEEKRREDLQAVFDELTAQHPEITAYVQQMMKDDEWEVKDLEKQIIANPSDPNNSAKKARIDELNKKVRSKNGLGTISAAEYLDNMSNNSITAMSYRNTMSDMTISGGGKAFGGQGDDQDNGLPTHTQLVGTGMEQYKDSNTKKPDNTTVTSAKSKAYQINQRYTKR